MAIDIAAASDETIIRITHRDVKGEEVVKTFSLDGGIDDVDIEAFLTAYEGLTNAGIVDAAVITRRPITGFGAATNALQNVVSAILALTFEKVNPINADKTVSKSFVIPAFVDALQDTTDKKPVESSSPLNDVVSFLETYLNYEGADGELYPGGFAYNRNKSGFGTVNRELDGL